MQHNTYRRILAELFS